ncbi:MAG: GatB/YqeY domain-containing protein [Candidatus Omnitrophica bacterium]|nr:GatB/YqeY domain-containing protein [Candidatus Omnitrophota bacterium]
MPLLEKIEGDLTQAMKARDALKTSTLRLLKASLSNEAIKKKKDKLEEPEVVEIIQRQVKQRRESIEIFDKGGRKELADKERSELAILQSYLPTQMPDEELRTLIQKCIQSLGIKTKAEMGRLMKELMPQVKGKADGKKVQEIASSLLSA